MSTSFTTTAGDGVGILITVREVPRATYSVDFSRNSAFKTIAFTKPLPVVGNKATLTMTAQEVDQLGDGYYRITVKQGDVSKVIDSGVINHIPTKVTASEIPIVAEIVKKIAEEAFQGIVTSPELEVKFVTRNEYVAGEGADPAAIQAVIDNSIQLHVSDITPHPVYDDLPSLRLLFENGLI